MKTLLVALLSAACWMLTVSPARADDWGCEVLLCLSDPSGPTSQEACRPPINKLWRHLAKGKAFPSCDAGEGTYVKRGYDAYYDCAELYPAKPRPAKPAEYGSWNWYKRQQFDREYDHPGWDGYPVFWGDRSGGMGGGKDRDRTEPVCRTQTPVYVCGSGKERECSWVYPSKPAVRRTKPNWIDVYVDDKKQHRVWW